MTFYQQTFLTTVCQYETVRGFNSHSHSSLLPHLGQLQSQFSSDALHLVHLVYSAKSSLKLFL